MRARILYEEGCRDGTVGDSHISHNQGLSEVKTMVVYDGINALQVCPTQEPSHLNAIHGVNITNPVIGVADNIRRWEAQDTAGRDECPHRQ